MTKALNLLKVRDRSEAEIRTGLTKITDNLELIDQVVAQLIDMKLLNDLEFAKWLINSRAQNSHRGEFAIRMELKKFGVARGVSEQVFAQVPTQIYIDSAIDLLGKKINPIKLPEPQKQIQKAYQLLRSRGYSGEVIRSAIDGWQREQ